MIAVLVIIFFVGLLWAYGKRQTANNGIYQPTEMKLLDVILDATLDGKDYVQIDRPLYERMKSEKDLKRQMDKEKECQK